MYKTENPLFIAGTEGYNTFRIPALAASKQRAHSWHSAKVDAKVVAIRAT